MSLADGTWTVLWHSVTWQYLDTQERVTVSDGIEALGGAATRTRPFAYVRLEPERPSPSERHPFVVRVRCWPHGPDALVARAAAHGPPVVWSRGAA
jgi:hypothetical protein